MSYKYFLNALEPLLKEIFEFYDLSHTKADASINIEQGWPIGADIYVICGYLRSELYIHRMYIEKESNEQVIDDQVGKLIERIKNDIYNRTSLKIQ